MDNNNTIYAISTAQGKSAICMVRISGSFAIHGISLISSNMPKIANQASYNKIINKEGETIDQTITTMFRAPKSFTGEDMVEVTLHGGEAVIKSFLKELSNQKEFRMATPGEFTRRAFENNKLDLTQVEAISDIVNAETEMQRKQAMGHLSGDFFKKSKGTFDILKKNLANIEAFIDFTDEELPQTLVIEVKEQIQNIILSIESTLSNALLGISIRAGFLVVILGKPNTGKSSFLNKISGRQIAIVTDTPGTTRDILESFIDIDGYPFRFLDTAGIRKSKNKIEKIGIELAIKASEEANINLVFIETDEDINLFKGIKNPIYLRAKQDLNNKNFIDNGYFNISSKTGYGINDIFTKIKQLASSDFPTESSCISRERHVDCLNLVIFHLKNSQKDKNIDVFAEDLRLAVKEFSHLFGNVDIEDILDIIFSDFCIGK